MMSEDWKKFGGGVQPKERDHDRSDWGSLRNGTILPRESAPANMPMGAKPPKPAGEPTDRAVAPKPEDVSKARR